MRLVYGVLRSTGNDEAAAWHIPHVEARSAEVSPGCCSGYFLEVTFVVLSGPKNVLNIHKNCTEKGRGLLCCTYSVTPVSVKSYYTRVYKYYLWARRDLNPRPIDYE